MQKTWYDDRTARKIRAKFGPHKSLKCKVVPARSVSAEREYQRLVNWYMRQIKAVLEEELPRLSEEYREFYEDYRAVHTDGLFDFSAFADKFFSSLMDKINRLDIMQHLITELYKVGSITKNTEINSWRKVVHSTLGLDLSTDYYKGAYFDDLLSQWVDDNVGLIITIPQDMLGRMREIVTDAYQNGRLPRDLSAQIQEAYQISKRHADLIARDQLGKLSGQITRMEHESAGVTRYVWSDSNDGRVRDSHRRLNGKTFEYANPPETDAGRHCNPGEDYQCRCVALPVFDEDTLDLPLKDSKEE